MNTSTTGCAKWIDLADRASLGEPLLPREAAGLRAHESSCAACAQEAAAFRSLSSVPLAAVPNDAQVDRMVRAAGVAPPENAPRVGRTRIYWQQAARAAKVAGLAAAAASLCISAQTRSPRAAAPAGMLANRLRSASPSPAPIPEEIAGSNLWSTADRPSCRVFLGEITVCLDAHGSARTDKLVGTHASLELERGRAVASLPPRPAGATFAIESAAGSVTAMGTIFSVEVGESGRAIARVLRGEVAVQAAGALVARRLRAGEAMLVEGGGTIAVLEPEERRRDLALLPMQRRAPEKPARNAKESASFVDADPLARARLLRSRGQFAQAAALYESTHAASPRTPSGRAALLGLAELRLSDLHDAAGALRAFDAYLAGGSSALAREAAYGRIRALRALGNTEQERAAVQAFLVAYPDGPEAESLRPHLPSARERGAR